MVSDGCSGTHGDCFPAVRAAAGDLIMTPSTITFPALLQDFFRRRLVAECGASAHTIASYRDTFGPLLRYAEKHSGRTPSALNLEDLDAPVVLSFLDHLETERSCCPRTHNLRLTATRSFMRFASVRDPACLPVARARARDQWQTLRSTDTGFSLPRGGSSSARCTRPDHLERTARCRLVCCNV